MSKPERSILWIDANLEHRSPTMRHLLHALPRLREEGWKITARCLRSDAPRDAVEHVFFAPKWLGPFELMYFALRVNLHGLLRWVLRKPRPAAVIHATCGTYLAGNLVSVHFVSAVWLAKLWKLGFGSIKEMLTLPFVLLGAIVERLTWWSPTVREILAVSDSIAEEVRRRAPRRAIISTLPNSYDETRFHPGVRERFRESMRSELRFAAEHRVFVFVSQGHYRRKGFWLAVAALAELRKKGRSDLRLLVVGGTPETLDRLRRELPRHAVDWKDWVLLAGMQAEVEKFYAAADAFLFPSYFEAFCLAEIEAAACGLPLLLTPHHSTEMILKDGINGRLLSFDPVEMSRQLEAFMAEGLPASRRAQAAVWAVTILPRNCCPHTSGSSKPVRAHPREILRRSHQRGPKDGRG